MTSLPQARRVRASLRRAKAGGERFLGGLLPGATARRLQAKAFEDEWAASNLDARNATGPLWVVLGDATSQGIGATTREAGYVGVVHEVLRRRAAWRVVNLSRSGAAVTDVVTRQLPELSELSGRDSPDLVTCVIGADDVVRRLGGLDVALRSLISGLPSGAIVATVPLRGQTAEQANRIIREEAVRHSLRLADLGAVVGPGNRGAVHLNDVGHAAWARVLVQAIDNPAPSSEPTPPDGIPAVAAVGAPAPPAQRVGSTAVTGNPVHPGPATPGAAGGPAPAGPTEG